MKPLKLTIFIFALAFTSLYFSACDDSGVVTPTKNVNFSFSNLQRLDKNVNGLYEAWMRYPTSSGVTYISCGKFNVSTSQNEIVDSQDNPVTLKMRYIPPNINSINCAMVSIEGPNDHDTILNGTRIMGGSVTITDTNITSSLSMTYAEILGSIAQNLPGASARYILNTPTTLETNDFYKGIWFCDTSSSNNSLFTGVGVIPGSMDWVYEGWIIHKTNQNLYSTGRFSDPGHADNDGAGPYKGPDPAYDRPGQDYVSINSPIATLENGEYAIKITLEPKNESGPALSQPFFISIFYGDIPTTLTYGQVSSPMTNYSANLPTATIQISTKQ